VAAYRYVVADVFTDRPLEGNQLAVFTDARGLDDETMQALALEIGFSETTFVLPAEHAGTARIRIFTPRTELPFAGHPVLGTAWVLAAPLQRGVVELETGSGIVSVQLDRDESGAIVFGTMEQPLPSIEPYPEADALFAALGITGSRLPVESYDNGVVPTYVCLGARGDGQLLRGLANGVEDAHVRPLRRRRRGSCDGLRGRPSRPARVPSRVGRVGGVDRDLAGRRDRAAVDPIRPSRSAGRRDLARGRRRPRGGRRARRVPALAHSTSASRNAWATACARVWTPSFA
jgi:Phenazine biosynthesis-like protein